MDWFALNGEEERPLFAFPGIYRQWKGPIKKAGTNVDIEVSSFTTTLLNALRATVLRGRAWVLGVAFIRGRRMRGTNGHSHNA